MPLHRYRVLPYRHGSKGAKSLADALGGKTLKLLGSTYEPLEGDVIINWGSVKSLPRLVNHVVLNNPAIMKQATNKALFFSLMKESGCVDIIPEFWRRPEEIPEDAFPIVCREVLAGHSGEGIVISIDRDHLVPAPLYVKYIKKEDEYRVHVGRKSKEDDTSSVTIAIQRKARKSDVPDNEVNWQVRNHQNGFVYVRNNIDPPSAVVAAAHRALRVSGLDFGAVDVIWNSNKGKAYVLEINTAPGIEGQTIEDYAKFFFDTA